MEQPYSPEPIKIRPFQSPDRTAVYEIFGLTAYHGRSCDFFFDHKEWLAELVVDTYLDFEPSACFVAEKNGRIVGYLTGTLDTIQMHRVWIRKILPRLCLHFVSWGVWKFPRTWRFFWKAILSALKKEGRYPREVREEFPAHLHINILPRFHRQGLGQLLVARFVEYLREKNVWRVHARTSRPDGRHPFFERLGFKPLLKQELHLWDYVDDKSYTLITYGLSLKNEPFPVIKTL